MSATIKNIFTRTQFILLASLLALVFLFAQNAEAATSAIDLSINPSDSSIKWHSEEDTTYRFYFDGSAKETKLKSDTSEFPGVGMDRRIFTLTP